MCQLIQEIDDDIESEELQAGSYKIRTIAQIHAANNDRLTTHDKLNTKKTEQSKSCVFRDSLEDITIIE